MTKRPTFLEKTGEEPSVRKSRFLAFCSQHQLAEGTTFVVVRAGDSGCPVHTWKKWYINELNQQLTADWLGA